jgi:catechol 2,3-dioxygenase-like lactoylglutathione lyase family enzyme
MAPSVRALHHMAFRCRDSEATRAFYEEIVGLELAAAIELERTQTGRPVRALHTFFKMQDGAFIAFFETPEAPFAFRSQHDFDLHVALEVDAAELDHVHRRALAAGVEVRGPAEHGFIRSVYLRDPNGYVVELCQRLDDPAGMSRWSRAAAMAALARWQRGVAPARQELVA